MYQYHFNKNLVFNHFFFLPMVTRLLWQIKYSQMDNHFLLLKICCHCKENGSKGIKTSRESSILFSDARIKKRFERNKNISRKFYSAQRPTNEAFFKRHAMDFKTTLCALKDKYILTAHEQSVYCCFISG